MMNEIFHTEPKQKKFFDNFTPQASFFMGIVVGIAVFSTVTLGIMVSRTGSNTDKDNEVANVNSGANNVANNNGDNQPAPPVANVPAVTNSDYVRGNPNAKVTLIEYSDFECPYCARFFSATIEPLVKSYGDKIRFIYRHFPLSFHKNAMPAALAAECAGEQGKFWEMHDKIFALNLSEELGVDNFKKAAKDFKLNTAKFNDCLDTQKYKAKITSEMNGGAAAGISGTPGTFVNGELIKGAVDIGTLQSAIDGKL